MPRNVASKSTEVSCVRRKVSSSSSTLALDWNPSFNVQGAPSFVFRVAPALFATCPVSHPIGFSPALFPLLSLPCFASIGFRCPPISGLFCCGLFLQDWHCFCFFLYVAMIVCYE